MNMHRVIVALAVITLAGCSSGTPATTTSSKVSFADGLKMVSGADAASYCTRWLGPADDAAKRVFLVSGTAWTWGIEPYNDDMGQYFACDLQDAKTASTVVRVYGLKRSEKVECGKVTQDCAQSSTIVAGTDTTATSRTKAFLEKASQNMQA